MNLKQAKLKLALLAKNREMSISANGLSAHSIKESHNREFKELRIVGQRGKRGVEGITYSNAIQPLL